MLTNAPRVLALAFLLASCSGSSSSSAPASPRDGGATGDDGAAALDSGRVLPSDPAGGSTPGFSGGARFAFACVGHEDCAGGWCIDGPDGRICSANCVDSCPPGWSCVATDLFGGGELSSICVPLRATICASCANTAGCSGVGLCTGAGPDEARCNLRCEPAADRCPEGFFCVSASELGTGEVVTVCEPPGRSACCSGGTKGRDDVCQNTSAHGSCTGLRTCTGAGGWTPCKAAIPAAEICDAQDNDCDGRTDEDLPGPCGCGDGFCAAGLEDNLTCLVDCPPVCGDETCSPGEDPRACPEDCCGGCGDGRCLGYGCGEDPDACPADCGTACGNGTCDKGENPGACAEDCQRYACGNRVCEPTDGGPEGCPIDCGAACGDCICEPGEDFQSCPGDCGWCGDGICSPCAHLFEEERCAADCVPVIPDTGGDDGGSVVVPDAGGDAGLEQGDTGESDAGADGGSAGSDEGISDPGVVPVGPLEQCNGVDDDQDGVTDEGAAVTALCADADPCTADRCAGSTGCAHDTARSPACGANCVSRIQRSGKGAFTLGTGRFFDVAVNGDTLYAAAGNTGVQVFRLQQAAVVPVSHTDTPGVATGVAYGSGHIFVADGKSGLRVYDAAQPEALSMVANISPAKKIVALDLGGDYAYAVDEETGLSAYDASSPGSTVEVAVLEDESFTNVFVDGDKAYVSSTHDGVVVVSLSDPGFPETLGSLSQTNFCSDVHVVDVTDPRAPRLLGTLEDVGNGDSIRVVDGYAYVTTNMQGMRVVDVRDPTSMSLLGGLHGVRNGRRMQLDGGRMFVAWQGYYGSGGLHVYDMSHPALPSLHAESPPAPDHGRRVEVRGRLAYVGTSQGVTTYDLASSGQPSEIGRASTAAVIAMDVVGGRAYLGIDGGLLVMDVEDPASPQLVETLSLQGLTRGVDVEGEHLYLARSGTGLTTVDLGDGATLGAMHHLEVTSGLDYVTAAGSMVFAVELNKGLYVIDAAEPSTMRVVGRAEPYQQVHEVAVSGRHAYTVGHDLTVYDVLVPENPEKLAALSLEGGIASGVAVQGSYVYIAFGDEGIWIVDATDPTDPGLSRRVHMLGLVSDVAPAGTSIVAATGFTVLEVLEVGCAN